MLRGSMLWSVARFHGFRIKDSVSCKINVQQTSTCAVVLQDIPVLKKSRQHHKSSCWCFCYANPQCFVFHSNGHNQKVHMHMVDLMSSIICEGDTVSQELLDTVLVNLVPAHKVCAERLSTYEGITACCKWIRRTSKLLHHSHIFELDFDSA